MGKLYRKIDVQLREFLLAQPVFFVATAPSGSDGHLNLSPKGGSGTFAVLDEHRVGYLDYLGSGVETIAHLRDNGRIVLMFCAFSGPPKVVRLHGTARSVPPSDQLLARFAAPPRPGLRSIIDVEVTRVSDSCGFQVPLMEYVDDRHLLAQWSARRTPEQLARYQATKNATSIDGLPALEPAAVPDFSGSPRGVGRADPEMSSASSATPARAG
jgi:hypothetical protein